MAVEQCLVVESKGKRVKSYIWHGQGDTRYGIAPFAEKCTASEIRLMLKSRFGFDKVRASKILDSIEGIAAIGPNGIEPLDPYDDPRLDYNGTRPYPVEAECLHCGKLTRTKYAKEPFCSAECHETAKGADIAKTAFLGEFGQKHSGKQGSKYLVSAPWPPAKSGDSGEAWLHAFVLSDGEQSWRVTDEQMFALGNRLNLTKPAIRAMLAELRANRRNGETSVRLSSDGWEWVMRGGNKPVTGLAIREDYYWLGDEPIGAATKSGASLVRRVLRNRGLKQRDIALMIRATKQSVA